MATYSLTLTGTWGAGTGNTDCYVEINSVRYDSAQVIEVQSGTVVKVVNKSYSTNYYVDIYMDGSVVASSDRENLYAEYEFTFDSPCTISTKTTSVPSVYTLYTVYIVKEAPPKNHKTLIGGTAYDISGGRTLVGGTGYSISKGRTLVGGTGYDIAFPIKLKDLQEGTIVYINVGGSPLEYYVAKHDYESGLNGSGRTLLVQRVCQEDRSWGSSRNTEYSTSKIDTYLNGTFKNTLDEAIKSEIGTTKFKYTVGDGSGTITTLSRSVFLLSVYELGCTSTYANLEGSRLPIYDILKNAIGLNYNQTSGDYTCPQWTRTASKKDTKYVLYVNAGGTALSSTPTPTYGVRPCFTLPADTIVDPSDYLITG